MRPFDSIKDAKESCEHAAAGTGMGLAIVKGLVMILEGRFWLKSEIGKGTTFYAQVRTP
jgi:signal transduction histidine kinase